MFDVVWYDKELDQLADAVVATPLAEKAEIVRAVEALNNRLAVSPMDVGESRETDFARLAFEDRVSIAFHVDVTFRQVRVARFRYR